MSLNNQNIQGADEMMAKLKAAQAYIKNGAAITIGEEALKHFNNNFVRESFDGNNKWDARSAKIKKKTSEKVLRGSGTGQTHLNFFKEDFF